MKKFIDSLLIILIICPILSTIVSSCAEEADCSMMGRPMIWCGFYTINEERVRVDSILDSLTVTAFYTDQLIVNNDKNVKYVSLPLRYTNDSTIFVFHYNQTERDTILIKHSNTPYFISMECGYEMRQAMLEEPQKTGHRIDSIYVSNDNTNTNGTENLAIFF